MHAFYHSHFVNAALFLAPFFLRATTVLPLAAAALTAMLSTSISAIPMQNQHIGHPALVQGTITVQRYRICRQRVRLMLKSFCRP